MYIERIELEGTEARVEREIAPTITLETVERDVGPELETPQSIYPETLRELLS